MENGYGIRKLQNILYGNISKDNGVATFLKNDS